MRRGFTLIELLVVVLIIGILAAIALPQYERAVHSARMREVSVRTKSLENALDMYKMSTGDSFQGEAADLMHIYEDVFAGLTFDGTYYHSKNIMYGIDNYKWIAIYTDANGEWITEMGGVKQDDGTWLRYCYHESDLGEFLCSQMESLGWDSTSGF